VPPARAADGLTDWVFGYASLVDRPGAREAELRGFRRRWNAAMDNSVDLPGYKHYLDPGDGSRPAVCVTYVNLVEEPDSSVNGIVFPVAADELPALDARERNYERRDVTDRVTPAVDGRVWTYVATAEARERFESARARGAAVVDRGYLEVVRGAFAALGTEAASRFDASTDAPEVPVRALRRVDAPASG